MRFATDAGNPAEGPCVAEFRTDSDPAGFAGSGTEAGPVACRETRGGRVPTIAVDLDDTLNNFSETLQATPIAYEGFSFSRETFDRYLGELRSGEPDRSNLLSTEFAFFKYRVHHRCYELAKARPDGVAFMRWLRASGWRIVICTYRDLRRANDCTRKWLAENGIPFDHLFMAWNKIVFCRTWGIEHLVDDHAFNAVHGKRHGVNVYYPARPGQESMEGHGARRFTSFEELKPWIQG